MAKTTKQSIKTQKKGSASKNDEIVKKSVSKKTVATDKVGTTTKKAAAKVTTVTSSKTNTAKTSKKVSSKVSDKKVAGKLSQTSVVTKSRKIEKTPSVSTQSEKKTSTRTVKKTKATAKSSSRAKTPVVSASPTKKSMQDKKSVQDKKKKLMPKHNEVISPSKLIKKMNFMFKVNEHVFYPNEGVGKIIGTEDRMLDKELTAYYIIEFPMQKMKNRIPVKNCKLVKLRKVISKAKAKSVLQIFAQEPKAIDLSWKDRLILYQKINGKGNCVESAEILASMHMRKEIRGLNGQERQVYDFVFESICSELAVVLNKTYDQVEEEIMSKLAVVSEAREE